MSVIIMMGGDVEDWGLILSFLDFDDPRGAVEQFNGKYIAGWNPFDGFTFDIATGTLTYPEDPPMKPISAVIFRDERIVLFDYSWVMVIKPDDTWQISRMD